MLDSNFPKTPKDLGTKPEEEKLADVLIVYRNNDLYENFVPGIVTNIEKIGRKTVVKSFSQNTKEKEIESWFADSINEDVIRNSELLFDNTSYRQIPQEIKTQIKTFSNLDDVSKKIIFENFSTEEYGQNLDQILEEEYQKPFFGEFDRFNDIIKNVLDKIEPKEVVVVKDQLAQHGVFFDYVSSFEDFEDLADVDAYPKFKLKLERITKDLGKGSIDETFNFLKGFNWREEDSEHKKKLNEYETLLAEKVKETLIENSIKEDIIKIVSKFSPELDQEDNLYIFDRHASPSEYRDRSGAQCKPYKANFLTFPLESMVDDARKQGLLNLKKIDWKKISEKFVNEKYGLKNKEENK